jgi:hypothetical protein
MQASKSGLFKKERKKERSGEPGMPPDNVLFSISSVIELWRFVVGK